LTLRVDGKFYPVKIPANGRLKPGLALVDDQEQKLAGGVYYIDWRKQNGAPSSPLRKLMGPLQLRRG
jgi:hypothetical protein